MCSTDGEHLLGPSGGSDTNIDIYMCIYICSFGNVQWQQLVWNAGGECLLGTCGVRRSYIDISIFCSFQQLPVAAAWWDRWRRGTVGNMGRQLLIHIYIYILLLHCFANAACSAHHTRPSLKRARGLFSPRAPTNRFPLVVSCFM